MLVAAEPRGETRRHMLSYADGLCERNAYSARTATSPTNLDLQTDSTNRLLPLLHLQSA